ncbi:hypothetical protein [Burkholderia gladioli]|nr:hypothetical protein [Burkholderia gladioli]
MFKLFKQAKARDVITWKRHWSDKGIVLTRRTQSPGATVDGDLVGGYLTQLTDDGLVSPVEDEFLLDWQSLYDILEQPDYGQLRDVLRIPPFTEFRQHLRSNHSLTDHEFSIAIDGWRIDGGREFRGTITGPVMLEGAVEMLMRPAQWKLFNAVIAFSRRGD